MTASLAFIGRLALVGGLISACSQTEVNDGPVVLAVVPNTVLLGRSVDVTVALEGLVLDGEVSVSAGEGVAVSNVRVAGPDTLLATFAIDSQAPTGAHAITVASAAGQARADLGLIVQSALLVNTQGNLAQGGLFLVDVYNRDERAFSSAGWALSAPGVRALYRQRLTSTNATYLALVAPAAPIGAVQFVATNYFAGNAEDYFYGDYADATLLENLPTDAATKLTGQVINQQAGSISYRYPLPPMTGFVELDVHATNSAHARPLAWVFGASGDFDNYRGLAYVDAVYPTLVASTTDGALYAVVADEFLTGGPDVKHDIEFRKQPGVLVDESDNEHAAHPGQRLDECVVDGQLQACIVRGHVEARGEVDAYVIDGLRQDTEVEVVVMSSNLTMAWAQGPRTLASGFRPESSQLRDVYTGQYTLLRTNAPELGFNQNAFGHGDSAASTWALGVASAGQPADYLIGIRPIEATRP